MASDVPPILEVPIPILFKLPEDLIKNEQVILSAAKAADVLGLSALLTTTMPVMRQVIDALQEAGLRNKVRVMVGGAPVNAKYAKDIGADGYAADAGEAVSLAKELMKRND